MEKFLHGIGIFNWYGYVLPFEERIKQIKEANYDYVMLWWEDEDYPEHIDRRDLIKIVRSYDIGLDNIHLPYEDVNLLWSEGSGRQNKADEIKRMMNECRSCGAETVVLHTTSGINITLNESSGYKSFSEIIREAEKIKLKVALENTRMLNYFSFILREIKSDYAGLCYDSSHDFINGQSCGKLLDEYRDRLLCVHLSDCDGIDDRHWIPGKGIVDWKKIISIIMETDCRSLSMETYPSDTEKNLSSVEFLKTARDALMDVIKLNDIKK